MRVAVISDVHANLHALDAVLASLGTVDAVWHLGDAVGYGPEPEGAIARLRQVGAIGVKGNHDDAAIGGSSSQYFNPDAQMAIEWTRTRLNKTDLRFLTDLPERVQPEGSAFTLVHGSPRLPIWEYVDSAAVAQDSLTDFKTPYCLVGHTHVPVVFREKGGAMELVNVQPGHVLHLDGRRALINPGGVGQPRDGDPRASYLILDTDTLELRWQRVSYDIIATQTAMLAAGLPPGLAYRLTFGL
jgi:predicted phosphodiesterase